MKHYILSILLLPLFFSCNQKSVVDTETSEHQKIEQNFNPLDYSDIQLDSINAYFVDSTLTFFNQNEIQKDTMFVFGLTVVDFFVQKDRFPSFFTFYHRVNGTKYPYLYVAKKIEEKYKVINSLIYDEMRSIENIYLEDINFDNKKDIIIKSHHRSGSRVVSFYHLIVQEDFKNVASLLATDSLYIYPSEKEIIAFRDGGNFGMHEKNFYKWIGDSLTLTKYWQKSIDITGKKTIEKFIIQNGKSVRTSYDTITIEEEDIDSLWH